MYKKKKNKLWIWLFLIIFGVAAIGVLWHHKSSAQQAAQEEEIVVGENQELINVRITQMLGNEMTGSIISEEQSEQEEKTWTIPVGTEVVTKLGTTTTFARLGSGNMIQMLMQSGDMQSEDILKIWITQ